jgi:hypothetical protein
MEPELLDLFHAPSVTRFGYQKIGSTSGLTLSISGGA